LKKKILGKGIDMYKNPKDIEARLMIMIGSMKAGNTSRELKSMLEGFLMKC
jgi:hypothetical protein